MPSPRCGHCRSAANAAGIATVVDVVNEGYRTPPGADETAAKTADELVQNEALRTEEESVIQVKFVDGSELSVEQSSEMVLSDYVFDGSAASGLINLNDGLFHFTSNGNHDQGVKLRTPVATIGVRGTEFLVHVDGNDATIIDILSGAVSAKPHGTGQGDHLLRGPEHPDRRRGRGRPVRRHRLVLDRGRPGRRQRRTATAARAAATATRRRRTSSVAAAPPPPPPSRRPPPPPHGRLRQLTDDCDATTDRVSRLRSGHCPRASRRTDARSQPKVRPRCVPAGWRLRPERLEPEGTQAATNAGRRLVLSALNGQRAEGLSARCLLRPTCDGRHTGDGRAL